MKARQIIVAAALVAAFVYFTTFGFGPPFGSERWRGPLPWEEAAAPNVTLAQTGLLTSDEQNNIQVYRAASPGVVNVSTIAVRYDFFLNAVPVEAGAGTGFFISDQGHVVTNHHVISGANEVVVTLADRSQHGARVIGLDAESDLAVVQIEADGRKVKALKLGDSDRLQVGQKVLAIGNPFGQFANTLTTGVISSLGRNVQDPNSGAALEDVIQTDAAINPGNSGGPLLNSHGEVVGINTAIIGPTNLGIGFSIPVNRVKLIVEDLLKEGRVLRPWLGVNALPLNRQLAEVLNLPVDQGLLVVRVERGSPADNAGIRGATRRAIVGNYQIPIGGDIIVELNGQPVTADDDLRRAIRRMRPGDQVKVTWYRGGQRVTESVRLEAQPVRRGRF